MGAGIQAELSLNTAAFTAAWARVQGIVSTAGAKMAALWPAVSRAGLAAFGVLAAGAYGVKRSLDLGGELADLSSQTSIAAGRLLVLQQAFVNNGGAAEEVGSSINRMQKKIAEGADVFGKLGIDLETLRKQAGDEQFRTIGQAIDGISDPAQRTAAAMEIFGKSGAKLLTLFSDAGALDQAALEVGTQAEILSRNAGLFDDVGDKLALTGRKVQGFFVGVADKVVPVLAPLLDKFVSLDLAKYGQAIGESVAFIIQALADGKLETIIFTSAKIAFANAVNYLAAALIAVGQAAWQFLQEAFKNAVFTLQVVTSLDFWAGMGRALMGIAQNFVAFLLDGIARMLDSLADVPLIGQEMEMGAAGVRDMANDIRSAADANNRKSADLISPMFERGAARMRDAMLNIGESFEKGFGEGLNLIDVSGWQDEIDRTVASVSANAAKARESALASVDEKPKTGIFDAEDDGDKKGKLGARVDSDRKLGLGGAALVRAIDPHVQAQERLSTDMRTLSGSVKNLEKAVRGKPAVIREVVTPAFR